MCLSVFSVISVRVKVRSYCLDPWSVWEWQETSPFVSFCCSYSVRSDCTYLLFNNKDSEVYSYLLFC